MAIKSPTAPIVHSVERFERVVRLDVEDWGRGIAADIRSRAIEALERGAVVHLPDLAFNLTPAEAPYLEDDALPLSAKSVKYSAARDVMWGLGDPKDDDPVLKGMLRRYATSATNLVGSLFPGYAPHLTDANASFRPAEVEGRAQSKRQDDSLLHVDAFPSRPNKGRRLMRVFSNIHPGGRPRVWRVGEKFADVAARFLPQIPAPWPGSARLLRLVRLTKSLRSAYDHYMLQIHDRMKMDDRYQREALQERVEFAPGGTWIVYTDQASHAAVSGRHALEQTFTLPVAAMGEPGRSPLKVLERLKGRPLV